MRLELFDYAWFGDFKLCLKELETLAMSECWDYNLSPTGDLPILFNYIHHTFNKLNSESKVVIVNDNCVFNTGLVTNNQEEIFAFFSKNMKPKAKQNWFFKGWKKKSDRDLMVFSSLPDVANYFDNPNDLIYDTRLELRVNIDHIIDDNKSRFPTTLPTDNYVLSVLLNGSIEEAKRRLRRNYKTAIPQYFNGKIQLLLPLCLTSKSKADLALVIEKENGNYRATTILTLDMAINNARLIAKPDDEWLKA